ncbi:hypothetical protein SK3146_03190 [Paenibacillus konkukensis]|uniref:LysM domain-containing protein n=1 Tax=Paenibacillus konkukensis TaxID=2020716 RepID=A0ABY4RPA5_9BACL|nr:hypothetical protein [Paenibacillus konkukensis]UQZ83978.1 hypothetical protein SK3146_03190 [Paenibacillus konkukensis]
MKTIGKKILTGTIAAGFLIGGGLTALLTQAQAQDTDSSTVQNNTDTNGTKHKADFGKKGFEGRGAFGGGFGFGGTNVIKETATILGVEQSVVTDELKQGKSLAEIAQDKAGLSEDDYLSKLTAAETTAIDDAVTSGKLKQEQADKQKANLADRLKKEVERKGTAKETGDKPKFGGNFGGGMVMRGGDLLKQAATVLGVEQSVITDELKQGKSLAQIAQDKAGLSEDDFLSKLTAAETADIDAAVASGKLTQEQADKQKANLADRLKKEVENTMKFGQFSGKGKQQHFGSLADPDKLAQIIGVTKEELTADLQAGKSLAEIAEAKGISEDQLISGLKDSLTDTLKTFVESKRQHKEKASGSASSDAAASGSEQ